MNLIRYANIVDGKVFGFFEAPEDIELKDILAVKATAQTEIDDLYYEGKFQKPVKPEPTKAQIAEKLSQLSNTLANSINIHLSNEGKRCGVNFEEPQNEQELEFYDECVKIADTKVENAQQVLDLLKTLPKFEVNHGPE